MDHVAVLHFAHDFEVRKLALQRSCPITPERVGHVLPRVHANPVESRRADPPQSVLNQVTRDFRIVLI